jgi:Ion transport protein
MYKASKTRGIDMAPDYFKSVSIIPSLFFVMIIIVGNFFFMNLFIGVIISKYNREKELAGKDYMLTEQQKKWVKNRMNIIYAQPKYKMSPPNIDWRQPFFYIAESVYIQSFILLCIFGNTVILGLQWYG